MKIYYLKVKIINHIFISDQKKATYVLNVFLHVCMLCACVYLCLRVHKCICVRNLKFSKSFNMHVLGFLKKNREINTFTDFFPHIGSCEYETLVH